MSEANNQTALALAIKERGYRQDWLAEQLYVTPYTVSRWVTGKSSPTPVKQQKLAELLGRRVEELFFGTGLTLNGEEL